MDDKKFKTLMIVIIVIMALLLVGVIYQFIEIKVLQKEIGELKSVAEFSANMTNLKNLL